MNPLLQQLQGLLRPDAPRCCKALAPPVFVIMVLAMMVLPLPAFVLDLLFTFNIAMALMVMMVSALHAPAAGLRGLPHACCC